VVLHIASVSLENALLVGGLGGGHFVLIVVHVAEVFVCRGIFLARTEVISLSSAWFGVKRGVIGAPLSLVRHAPTYRLVRRA
jgi:hypothetical protein